MKNSLTVLALFFITLIHSQVEVDTLNSKIYLRNVHEVELSQNLLKAKAQEWVARVYNNSNYVTKINNENQILTKAKFEVGSDYNTRGHEYYIKTNVDYVLDLAFKEGRYKIEILDLSLSGGNLPFGVETYLMSKSEFKKYMKEFWSELGGPGSKAAFKRIENDKKFTEDFNSMKNYGASILPQIMAQLVKIDQDLLNYLTSETYNDEDW